MFVLCMAFVSASSNDDLRVCYDLDNLSDYNGLYNLTIAGTPVLQNTDCKINGCYNFSGALGQDIYTSNTGMTNINTSFSIDFWAKRYSRTGFHEIAGLGALYCSNQGCWSGTGFYGDDDIWYWSYYNEETTGFTVSDNIWYHYALTYNFSDNRMIIYLNGTNIYESTSRVVNLEDTTLRLGGALSQNWFFGDIDEVRLYNISLSPSDVLYSYNDGNGRVCADYYNITPPISCTNFSQNISDLMTLITPSYDEVINTENISMTVFVNTTGQDCFPSYNVYVDDNTDAVLEVYNLTNMNESYYSATFTESINQNYTLYCSIYYPSDTEDNIVSDVCGRFFYNYSAPSPPSPPSVEYTVSSTNNTLISIFVVTLLISLLMALAFTFIPALRENQMAMMVIGAGLVICAIIMLVVSLKMLNFV